METVDVTICGGGPVGLLTAYCLARNGVSTYVAEQTDKLKHQMYGRAAMLAPRTLEIFEQLDLVEDLIQIGFITRGQRSYKDGKKVDSITYASSNIEDTHYDFLLLVRQMYLEEILREGYDAYGDLVHYGTTLTDYEINPSHDDHPVKSTLQNDMGTFRIQSKYLVAADGSKSRIRELAGIPFEGSKMNRHFIRIDGIVKTNMPEARRGLSAIGSESHGSVLWACLDHGRTRIGFAFPEELYHDLGENISQEDVVREAKLALKPFSLDFVTIDWWTAYSVGQRLAANFSAHDKIFLAGDAAHTHSSAAAQGLNIGIHDAVNLSWKLAGVIQGRFLKGILESYDTERQGHATKIVQLDSLVSRLHSGEVPEQFKSRPGFDVAKLMDETFKANQALYAGIGVGYQPSNSTLISFSGIGVAAGERAPDVLVQKPGIRIPVRLFTLFRNVGKFTVIVFCGNPVHTRLFVKAWRENIDGPRGINRQYAHLLQHLTIMHCLNEYSSTEETLGVRCFGRAFYDVDGSAHERYGIDWRKGMAVVLRPDGTVGTACSLDEGSQMSEYFERFVKPKEPSESRVHRGPNRKLATSLGEIDIEERST